MPKNTGLKVSCAVVACLTAPLVHALEVTAAAQYTAEYTDNTNRTENDRIGEWIHQPGADLTASQDTSSLELDAAYNYYRRIYTRDVWTDEDVLVGSADALWEALPNRLNFLLRHDRRESTLQALESGTQDNRQQVSTTSAGGTLRLQPRSNHEAQLEYTFTDIHADETQTDSRRHNGTGRYIVDLSPRRSLTLLGTYSDIEYDTNQYSDAEYAQASVGYQQISDTLDFNVTVGYNWYERSGRGDTDDPTYEASLTWRPQAGTAFTLSGSHQITDQSQNLGEGGSGIVNDNSGTTAAFKETLADVSLDQVVGRANNISLSAFYNKQEYAEDVLLSNEQVGVRGTFSRNMTPRTTFDLYAEFSNRDFDDQGDDQDELRAGANLRHRIGRSVSLNLGARYEKRDASTTQSYQEWIGSAQILWTFWGATAAN